MQQFCRTASTRLGTQSREPDTFSFETGKPLWAHPPWKGPNYVPGGCEQIKDGQMNLKANQEAPCPLPIPPPPPPYHFQKTHPKSKSLPDRTLTNQRLSWDFLFFLCKTHCPFKSLWVSSGRNPIVANSLTEVHSGQTDLDELYCGLQLSDNPQLPSSTWLVKISCDNS